MDMSDSELGPEPRVELMYHSHNQTVKTCTLEMIFKSVTEGNEVS